MRIQKLFCFQAARPLIAAAALAVATANAHAQEIASVAQPELPDTGFSSSAIPDAPDAPTEQQPGAATPSEHKDPQTKRILGIVPNFRAVSANEKLPPQPVKEKFMTATQDSFDYSSVALPLALAGYGLAVNSTPEFGGGGVGFGRYLWHAAVDQTVENYMVEFVVPAIAHEDTRYYTLGHGGFVKRTGYSLSRAFITRSDSGKTVFNAGEIIGAGAASGISNLYYPSPERTASNTLEKWGTNVGIDALTFMFKEFWPDINHKLFHGSVPQQQ